MALTRWSRREWAGRMVTSLVVASLAGAFLLALNSVALAEFILVEDIPVMIDGTDGNKADFGRGGAHFNGKPSDFGHVFWQYDVVDGAIVAKAQVRGAVYLDQFEPGFVVLEIQYLDLNGIPITNGIRRIGENMGFALFGANDLDHQMVVLDSFQASNLHKVSLRTSSFDGGSDEKTVTVGDKKFNAKLTSSDGRAAFGAGGYTCTQSGCTGPIGNAKVSFSRVNGNITGSVDGTLYWNGALAGVPQLKIEYLDVNGAHIGVADKVKNQTSPGGSNPNNTANQLVVHAAGAATGTTVTSGRLWAIRLTVGRVVRDPVTFRPRFVDTVSKTFRFEAGTSVGIFDLTPSDATVATGERQNYAFTWTVPDPLNWHDLDYLKFRIRNGDDILLSVFFDEASQTFALLDEETGKLGHAYPAGSNHRLHTPHATLHLAETSVLASGPTDPSVTLNLSLSFTKRAAGDRYAVEVSATDDEGHQGSFALAGALTVGEAPHH